MLLYLNLKNHIYTFLVLPVSIAILFIDITPRENETRSVKLKLTVQGAFYF